jgi:hypothetical protein
MTTKNWTADNIPSQKNKTILITGALFCLDPLFGLQDFIGIKKGYNC